MNKVQEFLNEKFGEVRVVNIDNVLWFVASDVAKVLQYPIATNMTRNLDEEEKDKKKITTAGGEQECLIINEIGLHKALSVTRKIDVKTKNDIFKWLTNNEYDKYISQSCKEIEFLTCLEDTLSLFNIEGIKQHSVLNYHIDYYIPKLNIAIEYDENNHDNYTYEQQEGRQKEVEKELGCNFIRVSDENSNTCNIYYILNEMVKCCLKRCSKKTKSKICEQIIENNYIALNDIL